MELLYSFISILCYLGVGAALYKYLVASRKDIQYERNFGYHPRIQQQRKRIRSYPGYPNGWYKVANVYEMKPGSVKSMTICGKDVVVYKPEAKRGEVQTEENQRAFVIDAYCPHLGAHLGDGKVCGDCIECPFHAWKFNGEGQCVDIPYSPSAPPKEAVLQKRWHSRIVNGMLLAWYDVDENPPAWEPHEFTEMNDRRKWRYMGEKITRISMHVQDFAENGADYAHFSVLHGVFLSMPYFGPILKIEHSTSWHMVQDKPHQSIFKDYACLTFRGKKLQSTGMTAEILMDGGGNLMHFRFLTPVGYVHLIQTSTMIAPCLNEVTMQMYSERSVSWLLAKYVCWNWLRQAQNDFMVWENKDYVHKPVLVKGDGPIMQMRRWYSQFYSDNSTFGEDLSW